MNEAKIILISSQKDIAGDTTREWILEPTQIYKIGRGRDSKADIDLSFDPSVSRFHAEIWLEHDSWWIKDRSAYGTKINRKKIPEEEKIELKFDDEIMLGNKTTLVIIPSQRDCQRFRDFWVEIEAAKSLNYALLHNGLPVIEKIILRYSGKNKTGPFKLNLRLENYFDKIYEIPGLSSGESFILKPDFKMDPQIPEKQTEASVSFLRIFIDGVLAIEKEVKILAYNEWSKENNPYHRTSLASFVLPNHPYIEQIMAETKITSMLKECDNKLLSAHLEMQIWKPLYNHFQEQWHFDYVNEPISFETDSQRIRLPHQVLLDWNNRRGVGTCIDLSLLFAACLENAGFEPILLIFEIKPGLWHVIVGYRAIGHHIAEPLLNDKTQIGKEVFIIIDSTGFARNLSFEEAHNEALSVLKNNKFLYGVDIGAARRYKILPLPFSGQPKESPTVIKIDKKAKELAEEIGLETGYKVYSPIHILLSLLLVGDGFTKEVFKRAGLDIEKSKERLKEGLRKVKSDKKMEALRPSEHYKTVWLEALNIAKSEGSPFILEKHLFFALLQISSEALDKAIATIGSDRKTLKRHSYSLLEIHPFFEGEKSFFGSVFIRE